MSPLAESLPPCYPFLMDEVPASIRQKYSPKRHRAIIEALANGNTIAASAAAGGISVALYYKWREVLPEFDEQCHDAEYAFERKAVQYLVGQMDAGNLSAVLFWLERRRRDDWGRQTSLMHELPTRVTVIEAVPPSISAGDTRFESMHALAPGVTDSGTDATSQAYASTSSILDYPGNEPIVSAASGTSADSSASSNIRHHPPDTTPDDASITSRDRSDSSPDSLSAAYLTTSSSGTTSSFDSDYDETNDPPF